ncbi:MAG: hypothetical protein F4103_03310, partial [Boseongicola sp. SB0673_bin_14]|nr:hypothetical protein [Boseongicola sp. SB0667_bin_21]MYI67810.1 hypothetical protein [Boseongicola sp. SB0673_bin_14]
MSDARWVEVEEDIADAVHHFSMAAAMHGEDTAIRSGSGDLASYKDGMALMHSMQCAHTSFENAMKRILEMLGEQAPSGESWHKDLVMRVSKSLKDRPAILDERLKDAAEETRSFRNIASVYCKTKDSILSRGVILS